MTVANMEDLERRLGKIENRVTALETAQPYIGQLLNKNIQVCDDLNKAVSSLQITMTKISDSLATQGQQISAIKGDVDTLTKAVKRVDDKGKLDAVLWIKDHWLQIASLVAAAGAVITVLVK